MYCLATLFIYLCMKYSLQPEASVLYQILNFAFLIGFKAQLRSELQARLLNISQHCAKVLVRLSFLYIFLPKSQVFLINSSSRFLLKIIYFLYTACFLTHFIKIDRLFSRPILVWRYWPLLKKKGHDKRPCACLIRYQLQLKPATTSFL